MKLGKLLAAGKSIMNGRGEVSYRANKQVFLPKFGTATNPFKSETTQTAAQEEPKAPAQPALAIAPRPTSVIRAQEQASPAVAPAAVSPKHMKWAEKFNPAAIFCALAPKPGPVKDGSSQARAAQNEGAQKQATQTELKLDSVKVLHNDLSDVDVEVVPIKSRAGAAELPAPKKSWEFLGERLFGVEAT